MFDPELNPYVAEIEKYRDIIITDDFKSDSERHEITRQSSHFPVVVDLGCGAGNFLRDYALSKPDLSFFGFELRFKRLVKGARKFRKHQITNARLIQARAEMIGQWFPPRSVREVYINFPDPWPKKKHRKHRLLNETYFKVLRSILVDDGFWSFKTDHKEYFLEVAELVGESREVKIEEYSEDLHHSPYNENNILTEFEALFKGKGYPVYYLKSGLR